MPHIRKIPPLERIPLADGSELILDEATAIALGDWLLARGLVSAHTQRRLAFGDEALARLGHWTRRREETRKGERHAA